MIRIVTFVFLSFFILCCLTIDLVTRVTQLTFAAMSSPVSTRDAEPTLGKFHLFGNLPPEIRLSIWKAAARSARPGVHLLGTHWMGRADSEGPIELALVPPKIQDDSGVSRDWVDGNTSTYNQDSGLWRACSESRAFMLRHYQRLGEAIAKKEGADTSVGARSHFVDLGGDWRSKVFPSQDLVCFQPLVNQTDPRFGDWPFFRNRTSKTFDNIALEYDPAWMNGLVKAQTEGDKDRARTALWREDSPRGVFIRALWAITERVMPENTTFWLVDRSIVRREMPWNVSLPVESGSDNNMADDDAKLGPRVFHSMNARLVQVESTLECRWDVQSAATAFEFLHRLQTDVGFDVDWILDIQPNQTANKLCDLVKVLCVEWD